MSKAPHKERTLVILKPDVIQRQIVGEILARFEKKGFKIVGMKMVWPSKELAGKHYMADDDYNRGVGEKAINGAKERGEDVTGWDALEIGRKVRRYCIEYLSCGPVVAFVLEGNCVIESVRTFLGSTNPSKADAGTIRADYSPDSYVLSDLQGRATRTLLHASDSVESAEREIPLWFKEDELYEYTTAVEYVLYDAGWSKEK